MRYGEPSEGGQIETVASWIGLGLLALWLYDRSVQYGGVGNAINSLVGQLAPVTTSSATFPPAAAPTGYYWAPNVGGGYSLQPLSNIGGLTGTQQSVITGVGNLIGTIAQDIFGQQTALGPAPTTNSGIPILNWLTPTGPIPSPVTSSAQPYYGDYSLPDSLSVSSVIQSIPTLSLNTSSSYA